MNVLFLCTGNSCRSQMAEGWARHLHAPEVRAFSAGTHPQDLDPRAVVVMAEVGVDISGQSSKGIEAIEVQSLDLVITVCGDALETCPVLPGSLPMRHVGFEDPPRLARSEVSEDRALDHYRRVRDEIRAFLEADPMTWMEK